MNNRLASFSSYDSLLDRLKHIHVSLQERIDSLDRIAIALYDPKTDLLRTFANSTSQGEAICAYEYKLADSHALSMLASSGECRVIHNIPEQVSPDSVHSRWLLDQGYRSSFTVPMLSGDQLLGFIFYDGMSPYAFGDAEQRDLLLYSNLIIMTVSSELFAVNSLLATVTVARDFAHLRDFETGMHLDRIAELSRLIARGVADEYQLSDAFIEYVYLFAVLHDIGKIGIPDDILLKPGALNEHERKIMETHVDKGVSILHQVLSGYEISHLKDSAIMLNIIACHHEYMDGSGYPKGLQGDAIPIEARIVTVADIYDALTSERPYKKPWSTDEALMELEQMARKGKLDSHCVKALRDQQQTAAQITLKMRDKID